MRGTIGSGEQPERGVQGVPVSRRGRPALILGPKPRQMRDIKGWRNGSMGFNRNAIAGARKVAGRDRVQEGAQLHGALPAERLLETRLRFGPPLARLAQPREARIGQAQLLAPPVGTPLHDGNEAIALKRQDIPTKRGVVHHEFIGQSIDRHRL